MNKMQGISVAFVDVNSFKFAHSAGIEDRIYIRFAETHLWKRLNKSDVYPVRENTRSDQVLTGPM